MNYNTLLYTEENETAYLTIHMPPANKMIPEFLKEAADVIERYVIETKMNGVIITGSGRHFSSGADVEQLISWIKNTSSDMGEKPEVPLWFYQIKTAFYHLYQMKKPVIAAINGMCIGSGLELALHTHLQIVEANARVAFPETNFGLLPGINGTVRCMEKIGYQKTLELILKGDFLTAEEALKNGLIDYIVPKKTAVTFAEELIHFIAVKEPEYDRTNADYFLKEFLKSKSE